MVAPILIAQHRIWTFHDQDDGQQIAQSRTLTTKKQFWLDDADGGRQGNVLLGVTADVQLSFWSRSVQWRSLVRSIISSDIAEHAVAFLSLTYASGARYCLSQSYLDSLRKSRFILDLDTD